MLAAGKLSPGPVAYTPSAARRHRREARRRRAAVARRRRAAVRVSRPARGRLAREPRAREAARRAHVLQLQPAARGDERLRGELPLLLVRAAEARRRGGVHDVARAGASTSCAQRADQPLTEVHVVNGLHPGSAVRLLRRHAARPEGDPPRHSPEVLHGRRDRVLRRHVRHDRRGGAARADGGGPRLAARRRRRDLRRARAPEDLPRQGRRRSLSRRFTASRTGSGCART